MPKYKGINFSEFDFFRFWRFGGHFYAKSGDFGQIFNFKRHFLKIAELTFFLVLQGGAN